MNKLLLDYLIPILIAFIYFFIFIGFEVLDFENNSFLLNGDAFSQLMGWYFFRKSDWFSNGLIGHNYLYGLDLSSSIVFSDSIPIFAIFFKVFDAILPDDFQYFGLWILLCFVLQSIFSFKLLGIAINSYIFRYISIGFFISSPIMLNRITSQVMNTGHLALISHFFIVGSLYFFFRKSSRSILFYWVFFILFSLSVHFYIFTFVFSFWFMFLVDRIFKSEISISLAIKQLSFVMALVFFFGWQLGYFSSGISVSAPGFGYFKFNIISLFSSDGWSYFLPNFTYNYGEYEGFAFLGLGILFLLILGFRLFVKQFVSLYSSCPGAFFVLFVFFVFSLSNNISVGSFDLFFTIPDSLIELFGVWRSSGRFIWPIYYLIMYFVLISAFKLKFRVYILLFSLFLQISDLSSGWLLVRKFLNSNAPYITPLQSGFWEKAGVKYKYVRVVPPGNNKLNWQYFAYYAFAHNMGTDSVYLARIDDYKLNALLADYKEVFDHKSFRYDTLYVLDKRHYDMISNSIDDDRHYFDFIDGFYVFAPYWH